MTFLTEEEIKDHQDLIDESKSRQEELSKEFDDLKQQQPDLRNEIQVNVDKNTELEKQALALNPRMNEIREEHTPLFKVIEDAEKRLSDDAWDKSVRDLIDAQDDFFTVATKQLQKMQDELNETVGDFVTFVEPATAIENMKKMMEGTKFPSQLTVDLNQGKAQYDNAIKDLCVKKLKNETINISMGALPVDRIKNWLRTESVMSFWKN